MTGGDDDDDDDETDAFARSGDPSTSHEAAENVRPTKLEKEVYDYLYPRWPRYMTVYGVSRGMGVPKWSISPRFKPLRRKGLLDEPVKRQDINDFGNIRNFQAWRVKKDEEESEDEAMFV